MIEFYELKNQIINELSQFIETTEPNGSPYLTYKTKVSFNSIRDLIPYLKDVTTCYFKTPLGKEILGLGELGQFNSMIGLEEVEALARENNQLDFMGAIPFDPYSKLDAEWSDFNGSNLFLPKFVLVKENGQTYFKANICYKTSSRSILKMNILSELESLFSFVHRDINKYEVLSEEFSTSQDDWEQMINTSLKYFKERDLDKVVLARTKIVNYEKEIDAHRLFMDFKNDGSLYEFFFHIAHGSSFLSFTPEKLYHLKDNKVNVDAIAGTLKRSDSLTGEELLNSEKDLEEHRIVARFIESNLKNLGAVVKTLSHEALMTLPKLFHIHSKFEAIFSKDISNYSLIKHLHPTPAVGGYPRKSALEFIKKNEIINRGLYAGPIGVISTDETEFAVGIRSLLVNKNDIHFYGGAGIVDESTAEKEWSETNAKIESVQCMM